MAVIIFLALAAAAALAIWRRLRAAPGIDPVAHLDEARRTAGLVNAVAYALVVILDALANRRAAQTVTINPTPVVAGSPVVAAGAVAAGPNTTGYRTTTIPTSFTGRRATDPPD